MRRHLVVTAALAVGCAHAFYLPGVAVREYDRGAVIPLKVDRLSSANTHIGYDFYKYPFCQPEGGAQNAAENLGEHLAGSRVKSSPYVLQMQVNSTCNVLCTKTLTKQERKGLIKLVDREYYVHWIVDNLPAAGTDLTIDPDVKLYAQGFPVGESFVDTGDAFLFNHHRMTVWYHTSSDFDGARVVGFDVHPMSILHHEKEGAPGELANCDPEKGFYQPDGHYPRLMLEGPSSQQETSVTFSYDVFWRYSPIKWASRWDVYLRSNVQRDVHWFQIINSLVISVLLSGMVGLILGRALHRDIVAYTRVPQTEEERLEQREETGWKLVARDVFRPPAVAPLLFAVFNGTGIQVTGMAVATVLFSAVGFVSPAMRGSLMIAMVVTFILMGIAAGYAAARTHKLFDGTEWQKTTLYTALLVPGICFGVLLLLNTMVWAAGSSNAIPFLNLLAVLALWFLISVPLVFLGAYYGFVQDKIDLPSKPGSMPAAVPPQPWYLASPVVLGVGGMLPFGTVFIELVLILTAIWLDQYYYVFGFFLIVFALFLVTCAEIAIVVVYFQLCAQDYRWWWRSWAVPATSGLYLFLYSVVYFLTQLSMTGFVPVCLYFGYMLMISGLFALLAGAVGFASTFWFVRTIYFAIKAD